MNDKEIIENLDLLMSLDLVSNSEDMEVIMDLDAVEEDHSPSGSKAEESDHE